MWMSTARSWDCSETTNHRTVCPVVVNSYLAEIRIKYAMCFERMYARQVVVRASRDQATGSPSLDSIKTSDRMEET